MTEETFAVELAGRRWALPHLPFRVVKSIQPALFKVYDDAARSGPAALAEAQIDNLAAAAWRALAYVDSSLTLDDFLALPFSLADLFAALPAIARAAGLQVQTATAEASPETGKSISTPLLPKS
jgi:hypothetical protein